MILRGHELTIVAPVYRNARSLSALVDRIHAALDPADADHVVLLVDDASPDGAWAVIRDLCARDRRVAGVRLERNSGQHRAILEGLARSSGRWVAVMDADLQDPPEALPDLLRVARSTQGSVFGARTGTHQPWTRSLASALFKSVLAVLAGTPRRSGTFFVVPAQVARTVTHYEVTHPHVVVMTCCASPRVSTAPFERQKRAIGESAYDVRRLIVAARNGLRCAWECRRGPRMSMEDRSTERVSELAGQAWSTTECLSAPERAG